MRHQATRWSPVPNKIRSKNNAGDYGERHELRPLRRGHDQGHGESAGGEPRCRWTWASGRVSYECAAPIPREDLDRVVKAAGFELAGA